MPGRIRMLQPTPSRWRCEKNMPFFTYFSIFTYFSKTQQDNRTTNILQRNVIVFQRSAAHQHISYFRKTAAQTGYNRQQPIISYQDTIRFPLLLRRRLLLGFPRLPLLPLPLLPPPPLLLPLPAHYRCTTSRLHYAILHYTTLYYTTLRYTTLRYTTTTTSMTTTTVVHTAALALCRAACFS